MKPFFNAIQQPKVSEQIVQQVLALIKGGKFSPGDKLPSERELIQLLNVGRSSLREAINVLETLGNIEVCKRKGIYVRSVS